MPVSACILCGSGDLRLVLDLGLHPLADTFLKEEQLNDSEPRYPLQVLLCGACGHAMESYIVSQEKRYQENDYSYDSSNSKVSVQHFDEMARDIISRAVISKGDLVVDIGSSVGTLLQAFEKHAGARIIGVEPAHNIAALSRKNGVPTIEDFWNQAAVAEVSKTGKAKAITITNAFNHIGDIDAFMTNIAKALAPDGVFVAEVPYLLPLVEKLAFDTIYLEHVSYFGVKPLVTYLKKFGMVIADAVEDEYMGGSIRLFIKSGSGESEAVTSFIKKEEEAKLYDPETYAHMQSKMEAFRMSLLAQLTEAKSSGGRLIGVGAATKGNTLLNYCGIDSTMLDFVTDASPLKVGKYAPGSHIPIRPDEAITDDVTHALILPWNIADFLKAKLSPKYPKIVFITPHM